MVGPERQLARLDLRDRCASTNTVLLEALADDDDAWPAFSACIADHQTAGRGRAGRSFATEQGAALTVSVVLRPAGRAHDHPTWTPMAVGLATVRAVRDAGVGAFMKWPNDVVVRAGARDIPGWGRWRKVAGILCEQAPGSDAVVAGIGINMSQSAAELPVAQAASLATLGATTVDRVAMLKNLVAHLRDVVDQWQTSPAASVQDVRGVLAGVGWDVTVVQPGGDVIAGTIAGLADSGALIVSTADGRREVLAGDVSLRRA